MDSAASYGEREEVMITSTSGRSAPRRGSAPAAQVGGGASPAPQQVATTGQPELLQEALVIEGWIHMTVNDVGAAAAAIRSRVELSGGRVISEHLSGGARSWSGQMQVKLPPVHTRDFLGWLEETGDIGSKRIQGTDVSRTLHDQEIALGNLETTLARMRKLLEREGLNMQDVLAIEREMQRLRGEIERIKGEKRFLEHRVAFATLDIQLRPQEHAVVLGRPEAKFYPGPRASALVLFNPADRENVRVGGGVVVHFIPRLTLELDVFEDVDGTSNAVLATFGGSTYSDFLGRGRRPFLNPYLGMRVGYGYLDGSAFVFGAGGGVELFKHRYVLVDTNVNVYGFVGSEFTAAMVASASLVFAF